MSETISLECKEFKPNQKFVDFVKAVAEQIRRVALPEATIKIEISKKNSFFVGFLSAQATGIHFSVTDSDDDVKLLILKLSSQIHKQVKNWKRFRFSVPYAKGSQTDL